MACDSRQTNDDVHAGYYVVCLIDLLGQKDKLQGWCEWPENGQLTESMWASMRESAGVVLGLRRDLIEHFQLYAMRRLPDEALAMMSDMQRQQWQRHNDIKLSVQQFSDTFVLYSPTADSQGDVLVMPMYAMLATCCLTMLASLAAGVPLRGSIHVGTGLRHQEIGFYGPALAKAHHLEDEVAQYPRILVSSEVVDFVTGPAPRAGDEKVSEWLQGLLATCRDFICRDQDGHTMVDFLGKGMHTIQEGSRPGMITAVTKAYRFACTEAARFKKADSHELAGRYALLRRYIESRLPIWGLGHLTEADDGA